jgi:hypothetical protein
MAERATRESSCLGTQFLAHRSAVFATWGESAWDDVVRRLSDEARADLLTRPIAPIDWVPERHMMNLSETVFAELCGSDLDAHRRFVGTFMAHGFGRIRRFFLGLASPEALLARAPAFWEHDHTHGALTVTVGRGEARAVLRDHAYVTTALSRETAAESFRVALSGTRARDVTATHRLTDDAALEVNFTWS